MGSPGCEGQGYRGQARGEGEGWGEEEGWREHAHTHYESMSDQKRMDTREAFIAQGRKAQVLEDEWEYKI